ncbi:vacuolar protein sorting-associated protein VPS4 [Metarhizium robertsii ARSEF 23]|uniref:Vacuolar protein sorting-associated protein VPS4 n=2 Tax=Metarhizium robertsii TaxID=568076 RepID=E9F1R1_METRA|nr:vacuolar protein sorting-associated protein VPS4 [Metarhizium robertsii ARSEF 23]EFY98000.1 vacuolar protein sorting-associated protein VPS4 [Metarhizium robertsii ARSEF 23]
MPATTASRRHALASSYCSSIDDAEQRVCLLSRVHHQDSRHHRRRSMSTNFRDRAIAEVQKAITADYAKEYQSAFDLYMSGMEMWIKTLKWEKSRALKTIMQEKMAMYLGRAENIKQFLQSEADNNANRGKSRMGANGAATGTSKAELQDDESKKLRNALSGAILHERPNVRWEDIAGLESAKETLKEAVILPIKFPNLFQGKRQAWKGILLYGPPGTGKSYLAKAVATEANSTFFSVSSSDLSVLCRLVKALFSVARENKPSVIFIDEIDALCGPRGEGESEASRRIKTEILVQMDGVGNDSKGILVLGATNIPWQLDAAIRRRFQRRVHIGLPDLNGRARMFKLAVGDTDTALQASDYTVLANKSDGFSGSDITNVVQHALMRPVRKILRATHFKVVMKDGKQMLTPCSPSDPEKIEMTYNGVNSDEILAPDVALKDFEMALEDSHPAVSKEDVAKQINWTNQFGSEGA